MIDFFFLLVKKKKKNKKMETKKNIQWRKKVYVVSYDVRSDITNDLPRKE